MKILKYKPVDNNSAIKATFSVMIETTYGGLIINDCKVFQKGESKWVSLPQRQYEAEGEKRYYNLVGFDQLQQLKDFTAKILEAIKAMPKEEVQSEMPF